MDSARQSSDVLNEPSPKRGASKTVKLLAAVLVTTLALVLCYFLLPFVGVDVARQLWLARESILGPESVGIWRDDPRYGWSHIPSSVGRQRVVPDFDVRYRIGADGNRVTPRSVEAATATNQPKVLFLGGSFTFGHGVEDGETYPALLQQEWPKLQVVNGAVNAWGTAHAMMKLEEVLAQPELAPEGSLALVVYGFITHHLQRNYRRDTWLNDLARLRGRRNPMFEIEGNRLVFKGLAEPARDGLAQSPLLARQEPEMTGRMLMRMARLCAQRNIPFHVVFLPDGSENNLDGLLRQATSDAAVTDLRKEVDYWSSRYPHDLHLQPHGQRQVADLLRRVLESRLPAGVQVR